MLAHLDGSNCSLLSNYYFRLGRRDRRVCCEKKLAPKRWVGTLVCHAWFYCENGGYGGSPLNSSIIN